MPKHVVFSELPKTTTGKIQKFRSVNKPNTSDALIHDEASDAKSSVAQWLVVRISRVRLSTGAFLFQSRDTQLIPCGMVHLGFDLLLQFLMFVGDFSDVGL